jgi:hypothetical protein
MSKAVHILFASTLLCFAADPAWKTKQVADWTADDAKLVLSDSPWAASVTTTMAQSNGRMGRGGGISLGIPGIGIGRGRGYPPTGSGGPPPREDSPEVEAPVVRLRWESALPIRQAELKAREVNAPDIDADSYVIAVYGVPGRYIGGDPKSLARQLKNQAAIRRDGQKELKPSSVEIMERDDGPLVLYMFPRKVEIRRNDRVEFTAQIGPLQFTKSFNVEEMSWQGKLEL